MSTQPGDAERESFRRLLEMARAEDIGSGDITSDILPPGVNATARFVARQPIVVCGVAFLETVATSYDVAIRTEVKVADGQHVAEGAVLAIWRGPARGLMAAERVALNFIQRLSGVATMTAKYVKAVADTGASIYDTRKTTPGWRALEKYAVLVGGGTNHRKGLYDAVLVKDNHLAVLAKTGISDPVKAVASELERIRPHLGEGSFIEFEVDTLDQYRVVLTLPVDIIMLDNMTPDQLRTAVVLRDKAGLKGVIDLEASGGITLANVGQVARTGVERIAVGALTHSSGSVDIALDIEVD